MTRRAAIALACALAGCAADETAILLTVCTNVTQQEADELLLTISAGDARAEQRFGMADVGLPRRSFEISLRPGAQIHSAFTLEASLFDKGELVISRRVQSKFVPGEDRDLWILLDRSCLGQLCGAELTCELGVCQPNGSGTDPCGPGPGQDGGPDGGDCDRDGDQYDSLACGGDDCDDDDFDVHPDARELCDQLDNDCSGDADEGLWIADAENYASWATTDEQAPTIAWGDGAYGVAWRATRECDDDGDCDGLPCEGGWCDIQELRFVRYDPALGTPDTLEQAVLSGDQPYVGEPSIGWSGIDWGVAYEDEGAGPLAIFFARAGSAGQPIGFPAQVSLGAEGAYSPTLAWSGLTWGVAWSEVIGDRSALVFGQVEPDGFLAASSPLTPDGEDAFSGALDWGDNQFGVAWVSGYGVVWFQRVSDEGVPNGAPVVVSGDDALVGASVDIAWAGDGWTLAWEEYADGVSQIFTGRLDPEGVEERRPEQAAPTGHRAISPDLAWSGTELALVWADGDEGDAQILLLRLSADGEPRGAPTRMIRSPEARGSRPAVSWSPERFEWGVVWQDQRLVADTDIWFNRLFCDDGT